MLREKRDKHTLSKRFFGHTKIPSVCVVFPDILELRSKPISLAFHEIFSLLIESTYIIEWLTATDSHEWLRLCFILIWPCKSLTTGFTQEKLWFDLFDALFFDFISLNLNFDAIFVLFFNRSQRCFILLAVIFDFHLRENACCLHLERLTV